MLQYTAEFYKWEKVAFCALFTLYCDFTSQPENGLETLAAQSWRPPTERSSADSLCVWGSQFSFRGVLGAGHPAHCAGQLTLAIERKCVRRRVEFEFGDLISELPADSSVGVIMHSSADWDVADAWPSSSASTAAGSSGAKAKKISAVRSQPHTFFV